MNIANKITRAIAAQIPGTDMSVALAKRKRERELRDAGYSKQEAMRIVAAETQRVKAKE